MKAASLYSLIKEQYQKKGRPLKIICDWDECILPLRPWFTYLRLDTKKPFKEFFEDFWERASFVANSTGGNNLTSFDDATPEEKKAIEAFIDMKKKRRINPTEDFYASSERYQAPFISIYEELLASYKENLIDQLLVISSCRPGKLKKENQGKIDSFNKTFGRFPNCKINIFEVRRDKEGRNVPHRHEWIRDNCPDFDIFIDDNYSLIASAKKNFGSEKIYVMPDYKCNRNTTGSNIYHIKTTVSDLKDEDFVKAAEEYKAKKALEKEQPKPQTNYTPWIIGSLLGLGAIIGLIAWLFYRNKNKDKKDKEE